MASLQPQAETAAAPRSDEDRLQSFLQIEEEFCAAEDYGAMFAESAQPPNLVWREMVCKWGYDVVDMMGEARSVVYVAMNILDRFCAVVAQNEAPMNEKRYECASMTALFLGARVAGTCNLQMSDLIHMSRDSVGLQDIISTGKQMLNVLTWGQRLITPVDFLQAMLKSLPASVPETRKTSLFESASFLSEISVCDIYLSRFPASQVAFASILNAAATESLLTHSELESFCQQMEQKASIVHASIDTRTIRSRLDSVYNRIEDNPQDNSNEPRYVSDDEEEEDPSPAPCRNRKRTHSTSIDCRQASTSHEKAPQSIIDHQTKRTRRRSFGHG